MNPSKATTRRTFASLCSAALALALAACGGGGDAASPAMIGAAGGTVTGANGAQVVVPANALAAPTAIAVDASNAGSPALPGAVTPFGTMVAFTPHGTQFAVPATVTVPFTAASVPAGATPVLYKTNGAGAWEQVAGATLNAGTMTAQVTSFSWFIVANSPPQITVQPADASVVEPATATFTVSALGAPPFFYQWQRSDDAGVTFTAIAGATSSTYGTGATAVAADNGDRYRVIVANIDGASTSAAALLTVTTTVTSPAITAQPQSVTVAAGGNAGFSVVATGSNLVYQWQKSGVAIAGQTNASLILTNVQAADAASYTVVVSNLVNGAPANSVTSTAATLTLGAAPTGAASRIAAGDYGSFAVNATGVPYTWGSETSLGIAAAVARPTAAPIPTLAGVRAVAGGNISAMAVRTDGTLWAWGYRGSIDCMTGASAATPYKITGVVNVAKASMGADHTLILGSDGVVRALGCNFNGQTGQAGTAPASTPTVVPGLPAGIVDVAAGASLSLALDGAGNVWAWGLGALGDGTGLATARSTPTRVPGLAGVTAIAAGKGLALALKGDGSVWAWGSNDNGKIGDGTGIDRLTPTATLLTAQITAIAAGNENGIALRADGVVLSWGINETGQLGSGSTTPGQRGQPAPVANLTNVVAIDFGSAGALAHGIALKGDGTVWTWGGNVQGELGIGTMGFSEFSTSPVQVTGLNLN